MLILGPMPIVSGHGTVDQSFTGPFDGSAFVLDPLPKPPGQEFTPTSDNLIAVDLLLAETGILDVGVTDRIDVAIHPGSILAPALTVETVSVVMIGTFFPDFRTVHVEFSSPAVLTPGNVYVIRAGDEFSALNWMFKGGDPYTGGKAIFRGAPLAGDFGFATYSVLREVIGVNIDIKPGSDPNSINCANDEEVIAVAILTTDDFDATTVDHTTVTFEGASERHVDKKSGDARRHAEDADGDGDTDLVFHFRFGDTGLTCASTEGALTGSAFGGALIEGTDSVRMVPPIS